MSVRGFHVPEGTHAFSHVDPGLPGPQEQQVVQLPAGDDVRVGLPLPERGHPGEDGIAPTADDAVAAVGTVAPAEEGLLQAQAAEHGDAAGGEPVAAHLLAGEAGPIDQQYVDA